MPGGGFEYLHVRPWGRQPHRETGASSLAQTCVWSVYLAAQCFQKVDFFKTKFTLAHVA